MKRFVWGIAYSLWARVLSIVAEKRAGTSSTLFPNLNPLTPIPFLFLPLALAALALGLWLEGLSGQVYAFQSPPPLRVDFEQRVKCNRPSLMAWIGEPFTYTLVLTNRGRSLGLTTLSDSLPAGVVWIGGLTASPGIRPTYNSAAHRVEWAGEVLTGPTVITLSWRVTAPTVPPGGILFNQARFQTTGLDWTRVVTTKIRSPSHITVTESVNPEVVAPGEMFTYTVFITNTGGIGNFVSMWNYLPPELTWYDRYTASASYGMFYSLGDRLVYWAGPVITGPSVTTISWQVSADAARPGDVIVNRSEFNDYDTPYAQGGYPYTFTRAATVTIAGERSHLYLPLVLKEAMPGPDLVVARLEAAGDKVAVVIKNVGNRPVIDAFWVDVYLDPDSAPTRVNQRWQDVGSQGLVWGVKGAALPIDPGETLRLTIGDAYYFPKRSRFSPPLAEGAKVYAQVDSINLLTTYGGVLESHEITGGAYNNIIEVVAPTVDQQGTATLVSEKPPQATNDDLPPRWSPATREEDRLQ